ncbi:MULTISPECIES: hypothetical protein [Paraburkholderia]|uniref:hypothetical protein n=1 Tax=Paraburkholderia TaxID=1822464 RepID=UPI0022512A21|nr:MULTISPECIES: hypothetical protein [Paraburkholderia]MCX4177377.1 hypothetical protein [Paraburkholderia madseniana]MDQ6465365.1 hypothetical protein [Paraburkholderia madseniana]
MLNREAASTARNQLEAAAREYDRRQGDVQGLATALYNLRRDSSELLIGAVESYVNSLASTPKEFDRAFAEYKVEYRTFEGVIAEVDRQMHDINVTGGAATGVGVAAGASTALLAPTAAMAIATTFGTASTGTAIASLSGAAATNAALAWLGGGALAAGGGGMSAGSALLALAGPIGWTLAGAAVVGGGIFVSRANAKVATDAHDRRIPIEKGIASLRVAAGEIEGLKNLTLTHTIGMKSLLGKLQQTAPADYGQFSAESKEALGALINHVRSLSTLLNKTILSNAS